METDPVPVNADPQQPHEGAGPLVALALLSMSTLIVEIVLTKFLGYKVYHHHTYAILATVILAFGVAGLAVYVGSERFPASDPWRPLSRLAALYAAALPLAVLFFCWVPMDPFDPQVPAWLRAITVPLYMGLFAIPFFLAGLCVCATLVRSRRSVPLLYAWDIVAAAIGAGASVPLLPCLGGYGTILFAAVLGVLGSIAYGRASRGGIPWGLLVVAGLCMGLLLVYPSWAIEKYFFDIRSTKDYDHRQVFQGDFKGMQSTYWNTVARIDVSRTGNSKSPMFGFGFGPKVEIGKIPGRYILVDGGANTRQLKITGDVRQQAYLQQVLFASPYVAMPPSDPGHTSLVIGGGGGIDLLVAKWFKVPKVDVVELNPATYDLLTGKAVDPERDQYLDWLVSDEQTKVEIHNKEGRHFCTTRPPASYDVIQASGVDTLTAIATGGMSLVENYLYTTDAVREYSRVLKPGGILSLTHWRTQYPSMSLRMLMTDIEYLESIGTKEPWRHILITADIFWTDVMMKNTPFTEEECQRVLTWARKEGMSILHLPTAEKLRGIGVNPNEEIFHNVLRTDADERGHVLSHYPFDVTPVPDDRPYFYQGLGTNELILSMNASHLTLAVAGLIAALLLIFIPLLRIERKDLRGNVLSLAWYFGLCGLAFMLFETGLIQVFGVFVGGPLNSLAAVLVSVLLGYGMGCGVASKLRPEPRVFLALGLSLFTVLGGAYVVLPGLIESGMSLSLSVRLALTIVLTMIPATLCGIPVALVMTQVRERHGAVVAWMWSINSAFNMVAAVVFVPLTLLSGIRATLLLSGMLYLLACSRFYNKPLEGTEPVGGD